MPAEPVELSHLLGHIVGPPLDARDHPGYRRYMPRAHPLGQTLRRIYTPSHVLTPLTQSPRGAACCNPRDGGRPVLPDARPASDPRPSFLDEAAYGIDDRVGRRVLAKDFGDSH